MVVLLLNGISLGPATGLVERLLSDIIERPVTLAEPPRVKLGRLLTIDITAVQVGNAGWAESTSLFSANQLHASIVFTSLFRGPVIIREFYARGAELHVERREDGRHNLPDFDSDTAGNAEESGRMLPVLIETATLNDIKVHYNDRRDNRPVLLHAEKLTHSSSRDTGLALTGYGQLQDAPWSLSLDTTAMQTLAPDQPFAAKLSGKLADLAIVGSAQLPALESLRHLNLSFQASGELPQKVSDLSPLLKPNKPLNLSITATDVDPGIDLDIKLEAPNIELQVTGSMENPREGDGFSLHLSANAANVKPLVKTLRLGDVPELPFELAGYVERDGRRLTVRDFNLIIGEHRWSGELAFPVFPTSDGAMVELTGTGPDFAFYQRLFKRPFSLPLPYEASLSLRKEEQATQVAETLLRIGKHELSLQGVIGEPPSYLTSDIRFRLEGPDVDAISEAFGASLPNRPYRASGRVAIEQNGTMLLQGFSVELATLQAQAQGHINGYPNFNDLNLSLSISTPSLADTSSTWGAGRLGDLPGTLSARITGELKALQIDNLDLRIDGLSVQSETGALSIANGTVLSDLELALSLSDLPQLLGDYGDDRIPNLPISMRLVPQLNNEFIDVAVRDITAEGISGNADLRIGRDLNIDEQSYLNADFRIEDTARFLPVIENYEAPANPITISARTKHSPTNTRFNATFTSAANTNIQLVANIPVDKQADTHLTLRGSGNSFLELGRFGMMPDEALPFVVDADIILQDQLTTVELREFTMAGSTARGNGSFDARSRAIVASLEVPEADLDRWIKVSAGREEEEQPAVAQPGDGRLIPNYVLPIDWLHDYTLAIALQTGPLGLTDPIDPSRSLVDRLQAKLNSDNGKAILQLEELRGSRGSAAGQLEIDSSGEVPSISTTVALREFLGGLLVPEDGLDALPRFSLDTELTARGRSARELAATLTGDLLISGGPGKIRQTQGGIATESFLTQVLQTLIPTKGGKDSTIDCSILGARAANGVISLDPGFVFRSQSVDLSATGEVNLEMEKIRIHFDTKTRKGLGVSAAGLINPYMQITGTLAKPKLVPDVKSGAVTGGLAAATAGISVLAKTFYDRFLDRGNPCEAALEEWRKVLSSS